MPLMPAYKGVKAYPLIWNESSVMVDCHNC